MVELGIDTTVLLALFALIGTVVVAFINGMFTIVRVWLDPRRQRQEELRQQQGLVKALYNEVIHMCKFLLDKPETIAAAPNSYFNLDVYYATRKDPIKFFMLPTAHELDSFYMEFLDLKNELKTILKKKGTGSPKEAITKALERIATDIVCSTACLNQVATTITGVPSAREQLLDLLNNAQDEACHKHLIPEKQNLRQLFGLEPPTA
ncbi:MAG: hypothetical protein WCB91_05305, partial [Halobacteriota archaeon]